MRTLIKTAVRKLSLSGVKVPRRRLKRMKLKEAGLERTACCAAISDRIRRSLSRLLDISGWFDSVVPREMQVSRKFC
jgi:hypothetical protein